MLLWGKGDLSDRLRVEWRGYAIRRGYWGRWLSQHRVYWHMGPLIISWVRRD